MKKEKIIIGIILGMLATSGLPFVVADPITDPVDMGVIPYRDFEYIMFTSSSMVDLVFVSSTSFDSSVLTVENINYYPSTNETKYRFTSNEITPSSWYNPSVESYLYQDTNTGQLYRISVDYSDVVVPVGFWEEQYHNLNNSYQCLCLNYSNLNESYSILLNISNHINETLTGYENSLNTTIDENVALLMSEYLTLSNDIDFIRSELDRLKNIENDFTGVTKSYSNLLNEYKSLNKSYNTTFNNMMNYSTHLSGYKSFENKLNSGIDGFYFQDRYYRTPYSYQQRIKDLEGGIGLIPIWLFLTIIVTLIITYGIYFFVYKPKIETSMEIEDKYGYDSTTHEIDSFSLLGKIRNLKGKIKASKAKTNPDSIKQNNSNKDIKNIRNKIDNQIDEKIKPLQTEITMIHSDIDKILAKL